MPKIYYQSNLLFITTHMVSPPITNKFNLIGNISARPYVHILMATNRRRVRTFRMRLHVSHWFTIIGDATYDFTGQNHGGARSHRIQHDFNKLFFFFCLSKPHEEIAIIIIIIMKNRVTIMMITDQTNL